MNIAIHQPNFLPWMGFFNKMAKVDNFVFLDSVFFSKGGYTNRVKICRKNKNQWLTVPIRHKFKQTIRNVKINADEKWRKKLTETIKQNYSKSKNWKDIGEPICNIINEDWIYLADLNICLIKFLINRLSISCNVNLSSKMPISKYFCSDYLLAQICLTQGADVYISGEGGRNYQSEELFKKNNINLKYTNFKHPIIYDYDGIEIPKGLSIIEYLLRSDINNIINLLNSK